jgi:hypothetical protein
MKSNGDLSNERNFGISRRLILKGASATAAGLVLAASAAADCTPGANGHVDYGKANNQTHLDENHIFPLLAGWLVLTANGSGKVPVTKATLMNYANLSDCSAQILLNAYTGTYANSFKNVRDAFRAIAMEFATTKPYSAGECPDDPKTIKTISSMS